MEEVANSLSKYSKLHYYFEKPNISKYVILAFSLLLVVWFWKRVSSKKETDIFPTISVDPPRSIYM